MNSRPPDPLSRLYIPAERKQARRSRATLIIAPVLIVTLVLGGLALATRKGNTSPAARPISAGAPAPSLPKMETPAAASPADVLLTASGYLVPHTRIELSSKFPGTVKSIAVKKGDRVKKGDVLVRLEDDEFQARLLEAKGRLALAQANLENAEVNYKRQVELHRTKVDSDRALDDARRALEAAKAELVIAQGQIALAQTFLDWCSISAPITGTVLDKFVDNNELIVPQSFGGPRGPSTILLALADLNDLQVEIDVNEADTPKVRLHQRCRIRPEAYPEKMFDGYVFEVSPEADRQKGTLKVKVQVEKPLPVLVPELTAKVQFLKE